MGSVICIWKRCAICMVCLIAAALYIIPAREVQASEEGGVAQPSSAKIYSNMSEDSDIIANLIVGNVFEVAGAENDPAGGIWYKVKTNFGIEGYVKAGEMDRLIMDAQAMIPPVSADTGGEVPAPESDEGQASPEGENAGEEDNEAGEAASEESNAGEGISPGESSSDEALPSEEENAGGAASSEERAADEETAPAEESAREESQSEAASGSEAVDGAGAGKAADSQDTDSTLIGSGEFTVIERPENPKVQGHGRIDAVVIMIAAGGVICIIAIAVLLKKIAVCIKTEA